MVNSKTRIVFHTFGCKLNFAETGAIINNLDKNKFEVVDIKSNADIFIIHTCSVTSVASKKCLTLARSLAKRNPNSLIGVIGCDVQGNTDKYLNLKNVNWIIGNENKNQLSDILNAYSVNSEKHVNVSPIKHANSFFSSYSIGQRTRSFLKVQDGCNYFCSYCYIPYVRGKSRSDTIKNIVSQANEIVGSGVKEIVLTGVNIGDFGKPNNENFYDLLVQLSQVNGLERLRISSIEPELLSFEIIDLAATTKNIMPHFHIPLQSGSDSVLKDMRRKYKRSVFEEKVKYINKVIPDAYIAADVIVGFPTETDELFDETYDFIKSLNISDLHIFTYSDRPNTVASGFDIKVDGNTKNMRHDRLNGLCLQKKSEFYKKHKGLKAKVLWEKDNKDNIMHGFTENYIRVKSEYNEDLVNIITDVVLLDIEDECYTVKILS